MSVRTTLVHVCVIVCSAVLGIVGSLYSRAYWPPDGGSRATPEQRQMLFDMLQPVALSNCRLERFGEARDGGYLMCGNLLGDVQAAYSYGISGYDQWGCDISTKRHVTVHQYDCFDVRRTPCQGGAMVFHPECVADGARTEDGRPFDTVANHITKNGDVSKHLVMKMDVEGAEWRSLLAAPDQVLAQIDQLAVEFHWVEDATSLALVRRLRQFFDVAHLHINNASCTGGMEPFPGWAYEVLFVNKRLAVVDRSGRARGPSPLDRPNLPLVPDCQP